MANVSRIVTLERDALIERTGKVSRAKLDRELTAWEVQRQALGASEGEASLAP